MIDRELFLKGAFSLLGAAAIPAATTTRNAPAAWDHCEENTGLPYDRALEVQMPVLDGPNLDLLKYRGYSVLINIFATWCPPCVDELPHLVDAAKTYYDRGLRVIGLDHREEDNTVRAYRRLYSIPYPIAMDRHGGFADMLEHDEPIARLIFPVTLFIRPDGYLYCYRIGSMSGQELTYRIEKFLRAAPPSSAP